MPFETLKKWGGLGRPALSYLSILVVALIVPACTGGAQNKAAPPIFAGIATINKGAPGSGQIILGWIPATDFAGGGITYQIFVGNGGTGTEALSQTTTNPTGITLTQWNEPAIGFTPFLAGNTYCFIVQAVDSLGQSDGNTAEFNISAP